MVKESVTPPLAMGSRVHSQEALRARIQTPKSIIPLPELSDAGSSSGSARSVRRPQRRDALSALKYAALRLVVHHVYNQQDMVNLKTLCVINTVMRDIVEQVIYTDLIIISKANLGLMGKIGPRQRCLIRSLKIYDETPTPHSNPAAVWDFIASLPNLVSLDIQRALIIWRPPDDLYLPNLRELRIRLIGVAKDIPVFERMSLAKPHGTPLTFAAQGKLKIDQREKDDWVTLLSEQAPKLNHLCITFAGPTQMMFKRLKNQEKGIYCLRTLELRLAEGLFDDIPGIIKGIAKDAKLLELLVVHGYDSALNWVPERDRERLYTVPNIENMPRLETIAVVHHRHHCDICVAPGGPNGIHKEFPKYGPRNNFDEQHVWFNAYWRSLPSFKKYCIDVVLHTEQGGIGGGHGMPWEEAVQSEGKVVLRCLQTDSHPRPRPLSRHPKEEYKSASLFQLHRQVAYCNTTISHVLSVDPRPDGYSRRTETDPRKPIFEIFRFERPLPDRDLRFEEIAESDSIQRILGAAGWDKLREHILSKQTLELEVLSKEVNLKEREQTVLRMMHNNARHHEDVVQKVTRPSTPPPPRQPVPHQGKAYRRIDMARSKRHAAELRATGDGNKQERVTIHLPNSVSSVPQNKFIRHIGEEGALQRLAREHQVAWRAQHPEEDEVSDHASDCHCEDCALDHPPDCACPGCSVCVCEEDLCCHNHGFNSHHCCKKCGTPHDDIESDHAVQDELYEPRLAPPGLEDPAEIDEDGSGSETDELEGSVGEVTPPPATFQPRPRQRPKRG